MLFKRTKRIKPPHRPLWCLRRRPTEWRAVHARSRCSGLFRGLGFFPLGKLLAHCRADHIRMDAVRFAASTRTLLPAWPESTQQRSGLKKNTLKAPLASLARSNAKCTAAWPRRSADDPEGPPKRKGSARWCSIHSKLSSGNADRYVCFRVTSAVCRRENFTHYML